MSVASEAVPGVLYTLVASGQAPDLGAEVSAEPSGSPAP
jgi:hypothetical protein